ncbi:MAG: TerB family tellurite resistance protein [Burkholderiaceae bacterium]
MRPYPKDSPRAAARIVALTLISDGQLKKAELAILEASSAHEQLGLSRGELRGVVHELCTDLLESANEQRASDCLIHDGLIDAVLSEVESLELRRTVFGLCLKVVHADGHVHDAESIVLLAAIERWGADLERIGQADHS